MNTCPNVNLNEYKILEEALGKEGVYALYMANNEQLPSLEMAKKIVELHNNKNQEVKDEEDKIINEIINVDKDKIINTIEDFSQVIKSRVGSILKNKNYERLKTILTTDTGLNKWDSLNSLLNNASKAKTDTENLEKNVDNLLLKARGIGIGIIQTDKIIDLIQEDVNKIVSNEEEALSNINALQHHLYALKDFKIFLEEARKTFDGSKTVVAKINDGLGKINSIENKIVENDQSGIIQAFKPFVSENIDKYLSYFKDEVDRLRKLQNNSKVKENKENYKKQADALEKHIKEWDLTQDKNILEFLQGKRGDANLANALLEAYSDSTDPIIASFTTWLKDNLHDVKIDSQKFEKEYEHEIAPSYEKLKNRFNPQDLGKQITNESERIDSEGNEYKIVELLNQFSGTELFNGEQRSYQYIQQYYRNEISKLEQKLKDGEEVDETRKSLHEKRKEFALWQRDFMQQEFNSKYYEKYDLWEDEIGRELKDDVEDIFSEINRLKTPLFFGQELDELTEGAIEDLYKEYILLGNVNKLDGSPKEGLDLKKALKMQEIRALNRELFEYAPNVKAFEKAKEKHSEILLSQGLEKDSEEYVEQTEEWELKNTREQISQQFYDYRSDLFEELSLLTEDTPEFSEDITEKYGTFDSNWEIINGIEYGHRDDDNQVIGTEIQEKGTDRIKEASENLEELQKVLRKSSGLSKEEFSEYQYLYANKSKLNRDELERFNQLNSKKKDNSVRAKEIQKVFEKIKELQSRIPTDYYIDIFNTISQKYNVSIQASDFMGDKKNILQSPEIVKLLKNEDFKQWFEKNHIEVDVWDNELKQIVSEYRRLPQWNRIVPNNPAYYERVPARKYSIRQVKPEYRTGYNPTTKQVELKEWEQVDNKGNFLPKEGKFKSNDYEALKNSNNEQQKALYNLLKTHTKYLLKSQENASNRNKLGLDIPRLRKSSTESNMQLLQKMLDKPSDIPSLLWNRIVSKWKASTDFSQGEGVFHTVFADKYGNEHTTIPIKYKDKLDASDVSLDLFKGINKYATSVRLNKKLIEISPIQQALQRVLGTPEFNPLDLTKRIKGKLDKSPKSKTNTRQYAVESIVRRVFEGEEKKMELGRTTERVASVLKSLTVIKSIAYDAPASIANVVNAEVQNFINASDGYITLKDLGTAHIKFFTEYMPAFLNDYKNNHIGKESLQSQIFDLFDFVQSETYESRLGEKISNSKIKDFLSLNWLRNHRSWGELFVQTVNGLAYLNATKIEQTVNNTTKVISLLDAYELDEEGHIKLKEGISEEWSPKSFKTKRLRGKIDYHNSRVHGNYAKDIDKPEADTYTAYSLWFMMKRFFISMALNRFAASSVKKTNSGIKFIPRYNQRGGAEIGYYLEAVNLISKQIEAKAISGEFEKLTNSEKIATYKTIADFSTMALAYFLLRIIFGFDPDDDDKYEKIKENDWLTNQGLYQSARLLTESSTFINPPQYKDFIFSEPMVAKTVVAWWDLGRFILDDEEYKRKSGIYGKGESKAKAKFYKVTGVEKVLKGYDEDDTQVTDFMKLRAR